MHFQECSAVISIPDGDVLEGKLPRSKQKLVDAWIEIHQEDLMADWQIGRLADWQLAISGDTLFKIEPLK